MTDQPPEGYEPPIDLSAGLPYQPLVLFAQLQRMRQALDEHRQNPQGQQPLANPLGPFAAPLPNQTVYPPSPQTPHQAPFSYNPNSAIPPPVPQGYPLGTAPPNGTQGYTLNSAVPNQMPPGYAASTVPTNGTQGYTLNSAVPNQMPPGYAASTVPTTGTQVIAPPQIYPGYPSGIPTQTRPESESYNPDITQLPHVPASFGFKTSGAPSAGTGNNHSNGHSSSSRSSYNAVVHGQHKEGHLFGRAD